MNDKRHGSGDQYGNRKYFHSDPTWWRARLTMGEARPIRPDDIQRELIKITYFDPVSIALLTGDTDKLDRNRHCEHFPMTTQGFTLLAASPSLVAFMTTCAEPDQFLSVLRDGSKKYRNQTDIDDRVRTAIDVYNATLLLSTATVSDQNLGNLGDTTPETTGATATSASTSTPAPRRSSRLRPSEGKIDEDDDNGTDGDSEEDADEGIPGRSPRLQGVLNPVQPVLVRLTFEECNIKPYHGNYMCEARLSKVNKAIIRHNDTLVAAGEQHGRNVKAALLSIAETFPSLLPMVINNPNCRDDRTGFILWDRVRETLAINQNTDSAMSAVKIQWRNKARFIPNGVKGLLQYKHDTTNLCAQYNRLSVGTVYDKITVKDQLEELLSALRLDRFTTDRSGAAASRWQDFLDRPRVFRIPNDDGGEPGLKEKEMQPSLAAFVTAGLDATWATLLLWSKEKKVTVAHNDEIDLLSAASHTRGAAPKGAAVTATAAMAAGAPQGQQTANWSSHEQPSTPQWPWIPAAAHAADGGSKGSGPTTDAGLP